MVAARVANQAWDKSCGNPGKSFFQIVSLFWCVCLKDSLFFQFPKTERNIVTDYFVLTNYLLFPPSWFPDGDAKAIEFLAGTNRYSISIIWFGLLVTRLKPVWNSAVNSFFKQYINTEHKSENSDSKLNRVIKQFWHNMKYFHAGLRRVRLVETSTWSQSNADFTGF